MFFLAPFCGPQSDWGFYSCQSKLGRWTHSVGKWRTHFYNISKCSFYFQRDVSITEMDGTDRTSRHSTTSNTNTCTPLLQNQMQLLGAHALQQSGVKHIIVWRQAKESAAFSLEWNIQSPLPKLWHIYGLTFRKRSPSDKKKQKKQKKLFSVHWKCIPTRQKPNCGARGGCICWCFSCCIPIQTRATEILSLSRKGSTPRHSEILTACVPACFSVFCRSLRCNTACNSVAAAAGMCWWARPAGELFNCRRANFKQPQLFGTCWTRRRRRAHPANKRLKQPCTDSLWMVSYSFWLHGHVYNTSMEDDRGRRRTTEDDGGRNTAQCLIQFCTDVLPSATRVYSMAVPES